MSSGLQHTLTAMPRDRDRMDEQWRLLKQVAAPAGAPVAIPSALLVFAHPDDESVALASRLSRFHAATLLTVTDGAPRNEADSRAHGFSSLRQYREARQAELAAALKEAGAPTLRRVSLGVPDQESAFALTQLTLDLLQYLRVLRPEVLLTHPYEGGHPDHDACAFAVHHAVQLLEPEEPRPLLLEAAFYHAGPQGMRTGEFLPGASTPRVSQSLSLAEQQRRAAVLACFRSQVETLRQFPLDCESLRVAPRYRFTRAPHTGTLLYDRFPWGLRSERFRQLAAEAERQLTPQRRGDLAA